MTRWDSSCKWGSVLCRKCKQDLQGAWSQPFCKTIRKLGFEIVLVFRPFQTYCWLNTKNLNTCSWASYYRSTLTSAWASCKAFSSFSTVSWKGRVLVPVIWKTSQRYKKGQIISTESALSHSPEKRPPKQNENPTIMTNNKEYPLLPLYTTESVNK